MNKRRMLIVLAIVCGFAPAVVAGVNPNDDMETNHMGTGMAFFYNGVAHHNCRYMGVRNGMLHFRSNEGDFDADWSQLPAEVKTRISPGGNPPVGSSASAAVINAAMPQPGAQPDLNAPQKKSGAIIAAMKDGMLLIDNQTNAPMFIYKVGVGAKGDLWSSTVYPAGTFQYTDVSGQLRTIPAFANEQDFAKQMAAANK